MYKFLTDRFVKIDNNLYFRDSERLRKIIEGPYEKIKIITKEHRVDHVFRKLMIE